MICLIEETYASDEDEDPTFDLKADCQKFRVKMPKKKQINKAVVITPTDTAANDPISVTVKSPVRVVNQWVGLYSVNDLKFNTNGKVTEPLPTEKLWAYTHCEHNTNNVPNGSCSKKNGKTKKITFDSSSTDDCETYEWPLAKGEYTVCVNVYTNDPLTKYKYSGKFLII